MEDQDKNRCYVNSTLNRTAQLQWTIQKFGSIELKDKRPGEYLQSHSFHAIGDHSAKWNMKLYPNGQSHKPKDFISYVISPFSPMKSDCHARVTFTFIDKYSKNEIWLEKIYRKFPALSTDGFSSSRAFPILSPFLSIENLLVRCDLMYQVKILVPSHGKHSDLAATISLLYSPFISNGDVTFFIGEREFPAHKCIMSARSPVFAAMFQHDMKEAALNRVEIVDIEPDVFQALLRFIYTDQVDLTSIEMSQALFAAAHRYFLDLLKLECEAFLAKELTVENCFELLMLAENYDAATLKDAVVNFMGETVPKLLLGKTILTCRAARTESMEPHTKKRKVISTGSYVNIKLTKRAQLLWTIRCSELREKTPGECFQSPTFYAFGEDSRKWMVKLYPNLGDDKDHFTFLVHPVSPLESECCAVINSAFFDDKRETEL